MYIHELFAYNLNTFINVINLCHSLVLSKKACNYSVHLESGKVYRDEYF